MEKKTTKKAAVAEPVVTEKKTTTRKCAAKKAAPAIVYNAETAGLRAGDIYQTLAAAEGSLTIKEIAKKAKLTEQETLLGMGWLLREGKLNVEAENVTLA